MHEDRIVNISIVKPDSKTSAKELLIYGINWIRIQSVLLQWTVSTIIYLQKLYQDGSFHRLLQSIWPKRLSQFPPGEALTGKLSGMLFQLWHWCRHCCCSVWWAILMSWIETQSLRAHRIVTSCRLHLNADSVWCYYGCSSWMWTLSCYFSKPDTILFSSVQKFERFAIFGWFLWPAKSSRFCSPHTVLLAMENGDWMCIRPSVCLSVDKVKAPL